MGRDFRSSGIDEDFFFFSSIGGIPKHLRRHSVLEERPPGVNLNAKRRRALQHFAEPGRVAPPIRRYAARHRYKQFSRPEGAARGAARVFVLLLLHQEIDALDAGVTSGVEEPDPTPIGHVFSGPDNDAVRRGECGSFGRRGGTRLYGPRHDRSPGRRNQSCNRRASGYDPLADRWDFR